MEHVEKEAALFEISPEEGVLTPDGMEFSITYTPRVFGEKASARLLVLTSEKTVKTSRKRLRSTSLAHV